MDSIWVFLLLGIEAIKTYRSNPFFEYVQARKRESRRSLTLRSISGFKIPTWITPLVIIVFAAVLIPNTSFLGHLCGVAIGYLCKVPPFQFPSFNVLTGRAQGVLDTSRSCCRRRRY